MNSAHLGRGIPIRWDDFSESKPPREQPAPRIFRVRATSSENRVRLEIESARSSLGIPSQQKSVGIDFDRLPTELLTMNGSLRTWATARVGARAQRRPWRRRRALMQAQGGTNPERRGECEGRT